MTIKLLLIMYLDLILQVKGESFIIDKVNKCLNLYSEFNFQNKLMFPNKMNIQ